VVELEYVGDRFGHMLQVLISPLPHHITVQYRTLTRIRQVFHQLFAGGDRVERFRLRVRHLGLLVKP